MKPTIADFAAFLVVLRVHTLEKRSRTSVPVLVIVLSGVCDDVGAPQVVPFASVFDLHTTSCLLIEFVVR